uniref:Lipoprotein n=1 Tax=Leptospirillum ferrodiazotrophum TaxID=412449 RepID=C6HW03_9BACT|nr:MAG: hypothetical protein UBAL3_80150054 [Leptospirillum ferrodiazotrophum]
MRIHEAKILSALSMMSIATVMFAGCSTSPKELTLNDYLSESPSFRKHLDRCIVLNATADLDPGEKVENAKCHKEFHFLSPPVKLPPPTASDGYGMGGGMGWSAIAETGEEKSFGILTFERPKGYRAQRVIGKNGGSFAKITNIPYYAGSKKVSVGLGSRVCLPLVGYLTIGDFGKIRFTRKGKELLARITLRSLSGKIVTIPKKTDDKGGKKYQCVDALQKPDNVVESIRTETIPVTPGKEVKTKLENSTVTISLNKDFPVAKIPAWPAYTYPDIGDSEYEMGGGSSGF